MIEVFKTQHDECKFLRQGEHRRKLVMSAQKVAEDVRMELRFSMQQFAGFFFSNSLVLFVDINGNTGGALLSEESNLGCVRPTLLSAWTNFWSGGLP